MEWWPRRLDLPDGGDLAVPGVARPLASHRVGEFYRIFSFVFFGRNPWGSMRWSSRQADSQLTANSQSADGLLLE